MEEVGWSELDTCLRCGTYVPEGRQVCPYCERRSGITTSQITKRRASLLRHGRKRKMPYSAIKIF